MSIDAPTKATTAATNMLMKIKIVLAVKSLKVS